MIAYLSRAGATISCALLVYVCIHTMTEVLLRALFGASTLMLDEVGGYALAAITFFGLPYTFRSGGLLRVQSLRAALPPKVCRVLEIIVVAATLAIVVYIAYFVYRDIARNFMRGARTDSYVPIPLWLPPCAALAGLTLFALDLCSYIVELFRGRPLVVDGESQI
ncbi:MAG: TRAP transporter small permease [Proteobacteria bacterium]|nr:TRAP transporter small permease [Pseudomonadota bacterium]